MEEPLVSIIVPVYNHERYIERCRRGIAMQKCDFPFEVWIGEDCSPDGSREVLKRLEYELPDNFHFLYREHNLGDRGNGNSSDLVNRCTGKYFAICEGDDFWTYDHKLQEQVSFLESHPDYVACFHHCVVVGEDSAPNGENYPECLSKDYSFDEYFYCTMPGQTATMVVRLNEYLEQKRRFVACRAYEHYASDRRNSFMLLVAGNNDGVHIVMLFRAVQAIRRGCISIHHMQRMKSISSLLLLIMLGNPVIPQRLNVQRPVIIVSFLNGVLAK